MAISLTISAREMLMDIKERIEKVLSDILSDKYEAKVTVKFEKGEAK